MVDRKEEKGRMISRVEPYKGYWDDSYDFIFSQVEGLFQDESSKRMLELGCGQGRFIERYAKYFEDVVAVERDPESLDSAMENAYWNDIENIEFFRKPSSDETFEAESFDVVLLGQSLQYMSSEELEDTFEKVVQLLKPGGKILVMVPHRKPGQSEYVKTYMTEDEEYVTEDIDSEAFEKLLELDVDILATRKFHVNYFRELEGLNLKDYKVFHDVILPSFVDRVVLRDRLINMPFLKKYFGTRMMLVLEKN